MSAGELSGNWSFSVKDFLQDLFPQLFLYYSSLANSRFYYRGIFIQASNRLNILLLSVLYCN